MKCDSCYWKGHLCHQCSRATPIIARRIYHAMWHRSCCTVPRPHLPRSVLLCLLAACNICLRLYMVRYIEASSSIKTAEDNDVLVNQESKTTKSRSSFFLTGSKGSFSWGKYIQGDRMEARVDCARKEEIEPRILNRVVSVRLQDFCTS